MDFHGVCLFYYSELVRNIITSYIEIVDFNILNKD